MSSGLKSTINFRINIQKCKDIFSKLIQYKAYLQFFQVCLVENIITDIIPRLITLKMNKILTPMPPLKTEAGWWLIVRSYVRGKKGNSLR